MRALSTLAAFLLVCIGVHALADRLDDVIVAGVEGIDAFIDGIVTRWAFSRPAAEWIDSALIVKVSRALAFFSEMVITALLLRGSFGPRARLLLSTFFVVLGAIAIFNVVDGSFVLSTASVLGRTGANVLGYLLGAVSAVCSLAVFLRYNRYAEIVAITLCLWVGVYRTPLGALARAGVATVFGLKSDNKPLLSYYSGGITRAPSDRTFITAVSHQPSEREALVLGAQAAWEGLPEDKRREVKARHPDFIKALKGDNDSEAMLALFAGETAARYAREAAGKDDLEAMAQTLPPGLEVEVTAAGRALAFARAYALTWPLADKARITSPFGWRTHPVSGEKIFHKGIDLGIPSGTEVRAAAAGVVVRSSEDSYNGNIVVVDHGDGVRTLYLHNSERYVGKGMKVVAGQPLARSGATGIATGPHLHYQLEIGAIPHDPMSFRK